MFRIKSNRPAIESLDIFAPRLPIYFEREPYLYNIILTEYMGDCNTFSKWLNLYSRDPAYNIEFWNIIFQISYACYVMSLSKLVHNDLHSDNIFIKDLGVNTLFIYNINSVKIKIITRYQPLIYDFDRGYCERFGENTLLDNTCNISSQCNIFVENKDIVKILCYVYKQSTYPITNNIIDLVGKNDTYKKNLKNTYDLKSRRDGLKKCFLQYIDIMDDRIKSIPVDWYSNFNNNFDILFEISENYLPKYTDRDDPLDTNNIFTCNVDFFDSRGVIIPEKLILTKYTADAPPSLTPLILSPARFLKTSEILLSGFDLKTPSFLKDT